MFTVKKRINFIKILFTVCAIIFSVITAPALTENAPHNSSSKVKIQILSKHIRLLRESKTDHLRLSFPGSCEIGTGIKRIPCSTLSITCRNRFLNINTENTLIEKRDFNVYSKKRGDTFSININGENRFYPLPLYVKYDGTEIEFSVEETVNRYAIDSAWAELGDVPEKNYEALYALAHIIKARCAFSWFTDKHNGCNFCDLTCCQSYKGISGKTFNDPVSIKTSNIKNGFFFHSSSGGTLFTDSIFNGKERRINPPKDFIYSENIALSSEKHKSWTASIGESELAAILYPGEKTFLKKITFNRDREILILKKDREEEKLSPETFRIKINRIKGWNFLKSNNYSLTEADGIYKFNGTGLGHGAGMSLEGALQLAERGYSRFEIIEHYYPDVEYNIPRSSTVNHQLQYIVFNSESGEIIKSSTGISFTQRIVPCGSIFKLFIALYLAEKRTDLFFNYTYTCTDKEKDQLIPEYCWKKSGHGKMNLESALFNSCNKYFASLYDRIDPEDFKKWISVFTQKNGIVLTIPETDDRAGFSNLLAGLNFRSTITVDGIIKLNRYLYIINKEHPTEEAGIIFNALHKTFTDGTAKEIAEENNSLPDRINRNGLWGKTGTVIAGTNNHYSYGIFTGGLSATGIVAVLRKGTGAMAARESEKILLNIK